MSTAVKYKTEKIDGLDIFYREAGSPSNPTLLLLHGFPTSSHMFRNLIPKLAEQFHLVAPDYPGYGQSSMPLVDEFEYTFDKVSDIVDKLLQRLKIESFAMYVQDYGAPVGYRLAMKHPEQVTGLVVQNGNAFEEGLKDFWIPIRAYWKERTPEHTDALRGLLKLEATNWQYTEGARNVYVVEMNMGHIMAQVRQAAWKPDRVFLVNRVDGQLITPTDIGSCTGT